MKITNDQKSILTVAAVGAAGLFVIGRMVGRSVAGATEKVNPASKENLVYRGVNAVGDVFDNGSTDDSFSVGTWIYDVFHPNENFDNFLPPSSKVAK